MNPTVRILCLLVFAGGVAGARGGQLLAGTLLLGGAFAVVGTGAGARLLYLLRRVRWILLSLVILYGWFTPGRSVLPALGPFAPTWAGLAFGGARTLALVLMVAAVHLLLTATHRDQLLAAILGLVRPLRRLGVPHERLAVRMVLTLHAVPQVQPLVRDAVRSSAARGPVLRRASRTAAAVFTAVLGRAGQEAGESVSVPAPAPVPWYEWTYPLWLAALFWVAATL